MITLEELKEINKIKSDENKFVSLYLNTDQKINSTEKIQIKLKNLLAKAEHELSADDIKKIDYYFNKSIKNRSKSVVFFVGKNEDVWRYYEFKKPLPSSVHIENNLHITPLQKMLDEYERYGVLVLDNEKAKVFTVYLGEIEEIKDLSDYYPGKHAQGGWSQKRFQGHIEDHLLKHLKHSAEVIYQIWKDKKFDRLILGGADEIIAKLEQGLPSDIKKIVSGKFNTELFKPLEHFLNQSLEIEEQAERNKEEKIINELENNLGDGNKAVSGIRDVLNSINEKRVMRLIIQEVAEQKGYYCKECDMLLLEKNECPCEGENYQVDLIDEMVQKALSQQAEVEFVKWEDKMNKLGNIGAILRY